MKVVTFLLLLLLFIIGCKPEKVVNETPPVPPVVETPPVTPKVEEPIVSNPQPKTPSKEFLKGYWEGYANNWWGPIHWTISTDFRSGRALGKKDRKQGLPPRYNPPSP
jgi:hypothetical protein